MMPLPWQPDEGGYNTDDNEAEDDGQQNDNRQENCNAPNNRLLLPNITQITCYDTNMIYREFNVDCKLSVVSLTL